MITKWAPEVRRIGLGQGLDKEKDKAVIESFQCFKEKELQRLDATSDILNSRVHHIFNKVGFKAARSMVENLDPMFDFSKKEVEDLESEVLESFAEKGLKEDTRYHLIDPGGKSRTFSHHEKYKHIRYHFDYNLK